MKQNIKEMKKYLVIVLFTIISNSFAQIPIGENFDKGKKDFINLMKTNDFNIYKEGMIIPMKYNPKTGKADIPSDKKPACYQILFKEEVEVKICFNKYGNIKEMFIITENKKNKEKILNIFNFKKWEFLKERTTKYIGNSKIYRIGNIYALISNSQISQINFYNYIP